MAKTSGDSRKIVATVDSGEAIHLNAVLRKGGRRIGHTRIDSLPARLKDVKVPVRPAAGKGNAKLEVTLRDAAGDVVSTDHSVKLPSR